MAIIKTPGQLPQKWTDAGYLHDPMGTSPFPYPTGMPEGLWMQTRFAPTFALTPAVPKVVARASWSCPIFDLRPNFRGLLNTGSSGQRNAAAATPIWINRGAAGKLWVQIQGLNTFGNTRAGLRVNAQESANIMDSSNMQPVTDEEDITTEFVGTQNSVIVSYLPTGAGYPLRYWSVRIQFDYLIDLSALGYAWWTPGNAPAPQWVLSAAFY